VLAIHRFRAVGITDIAAGAIAVQAAPVVPAAGVLRQVAAERADVADLRARDPRCRLRQQAVIAIDAFVTDDVAQRGCRTDLEPVLRFPDSLQRLDTVQVDHRARVFGAILEPPVGVLSATEQPTVLAEFVGQVKRIVQFYRLVELYFGHYIERSHRYLRSCWFVAACKTGRAP